MRTSMAHCLESSSSKRHQTGRNCSLQSYMIRSLILPLGKALSNKRRWARSSSAYKYMPTIIKKHKNSSEQFRTQALFRDQPMTGTQLQRNYQMLSERVEDKFRHMAKAYRFFDSDKVSRNIVLCT